MQYNFIEYLRLNEAVKEKVFKITINDSEYTISRESHIFDKRGNDNKPRDFSMSKTKYQTVLEKFLSMYILVNVVNIKKPVTITWEDKNNKNNAFSANINLTSNLISVFGAIMNSNTSDPVKLYVNAKNRIHLGKI